ncbi:hypothetical protein POM88_030570 [Heracleum sosnowskyi]|uniref:Uncharacterized protein n=1 Tax=Heracleum sosnowskyi TaxID=360622 RepID=A0AAD8HVR3_9APIA|nr:hypothetical protein POM88_030570 [Heracleum sosnowskyi]
MTKREYSSRITAAMNDLKEFSKSKLEEFKVETEKLLARKIEELKELAAGDSTGKPRNKAECMQTTGQASMQKSPQAEPQIEQDGSDSSLMNWTLPLDCVGEGSEMDAAVDVVSNDFEINSEAEQERCELISSNNEGENEEIEVAELEGLSTLDGPRKSRRTVKEPAWMKDFTTVGKNEGKTELLSNDFEINSEAEQEGCELISSNNEGENEEIGVAELEGLSTLDGPRKSRRTVKEPAWMKDFTTVGKNEVKTEVVSHDFEINSEAEQERCELISSNNEGENEEIEVAELEGLSNWMDQESQGLKEPAWMKDFTTVAKNEGKSEGAESDDHSTLGGPRKSERAAKEPAWMKDFMTD